MDCASHQASVVSRCSRVQSDSGTEGRCGHTPAAEHVGPCSPTAAGRPPNRSSSAAGARALGQPAPGEPERRGGRQISSRGHPRRCWQSSTTLRVRSTNCSATIVSMGPIERPPRPARCEYPAGIPRAASTRTGHLMRKVGSKGPDEDVLAGGVVQQRLLAGEADTERLGHGVVGQFGAGGLERPRRVVDVRASHVGRGDPGCRGSSARSGNARGSRPRRGSPVQWAGSSRGGRRPAVGGAAAVVDAAAPIV